MLQEDVIRRVVFFLERTTFGWSVHSSINSIRNGLSLERTPQTSKSNQEDLKLIYNSLIYRLKYPNRKFKVHRSSSRIRCQFNCRQKPENFFSVKNAAKNSRIWIHLCLITFCTVIVEDLSVSSVRGVTPDCTGSDFTWRHMQISYQSCVSFAMTTFFQPNCMTSICNRCTTWIMMEWIKYCCHWRSSRTIHFCAWDVEGGLSLRSTLKCIIRCMHWQKGKLPPQMSRYWIIIISS